MEIRKVMEHYEIYVNGIFYCSCDTHEEAEIVKLHKFCHDFYAIFKTKIVDFYIDMVYTKDS